MSNNDSDPIVAIATAPGRGGIGVVRLSFGRAGEAAAKHAMLALCAQALVNSGAPNLRSEALNLHHKALRACRRLQEVLKLLVPSGAKAREPGRPEVENASVRRTAFR